MHMRAEDLGDEYASAMQSELTAWLTQGRRLQNRRQRRVAAGGPRGLAQHPPAGLARPG